MNGRKITATVIHTAFENAPRVVATIEIPDEMAAARETGFSAVAEYCYRWTNNIEGSWSLGEQDNSDYNENVTSEDDSESEYGQRSTSKATSLKS